MGGKIRVYNISAGGARFEISFSVADPVKRLLLVMQ
jgi:C4-dicarboxylate-specific signal transduction histidine kinase